MMGRPFLYHNAVADGKTRVGRICREQLPAGAKWCWFLERRGIEPSEDVLPRLSLLHATASHCCESCPSKRACRKSLDDAPESVSFAPSFCRSSDVLAELQFINLNACS
jgi:hypothetical protein